MRIFCECGDELLNEKTFEHFKFSFADESQTFFCSDKECEIKTKIIIKGS